MTYSGHPENKENEPHRPRCAYEQITECYTTYRIRDVRIFG